MDEELKAKVKAVLLDPEMRQQLADLLADVSVRNALAADLEERRVGRLADLDESSQLEAMAAFVLSRDLAEDDSEDLDEDGQALEAAVEQLLEDEKGRAAVKAMLETPDFRDMLSSQLAESTPGVTIDDLPEELQLKIAASTMLVINAEAGDEDEDE